MRDFRFSLLHGALLSFCFLASLLMAFAGNNEMAQMRENVMVRSDEVGESVVSSVDSDAEGLVVSATNKYTYGTYKVISGDSLYWIAENYDTTINHLRTLNSLHSDTIQPGDVLKVPLNTLKEYPIGIRLTDKEVQWLAQMIHAEARGEPYRGQVAVGAVILNRLKSRQFPSTLREVLFQRNAFQPVRNGSFFHPPNDIAYRAALDGLNGVDPTNGALFFFNPQQSTDRFMHGRAAVVTIGRHRFMY